jgi:hypothetical protein
MIAHQTEGGSYSGSASSAYTNTSLAPYIESFRAWLRPLHADSVAELKRAKEVSKQVTAMEWRLLCCRQGVACRHCRSMSHPIRLPCMYSIKTKMT